MFGLVTSEALSHSWRAAGESRASAPPRRVPSRDGPPAPFRESGRRALVHLVIIKRLFESRTAGFFFKRFLKSESEFLIF